MGESTHITWCDHTFSPWEGCEKISPGCKNCYAAARDARWHDGEHWGPTGKRLLHTDSYWRQPVKWNREAVAAGVRRRVFCASIADVFEDRPELVAPRRRLYQLILATPSLDWLLLTKRPENAQRLLQAAAFVYADEVPVENRREPYPEEVEGMWPRNVWLGVTAEDPQRADERIPVLLSIGGPAVRFVSYEPALAPVDFFHYLREPEDDRGRLGHALDWIIVGGESGPGARPFDVAWARSTVAQCKAAGVACFVKQLGRRPFVGDDQGWPPRVLVAPHRNVVPDAEYQAYLADRAGADPSEWPADLRVQEHPR